MPVLELKGEKKESYIRKLAACLNKARELDLGCDSELEKIITQTGFLSRTEDFGIIDSIKVDNESGFLHIATITDLAVKKDAADRKLEKLPKREAVSQSIINQLHTDNPDFSVNKNLLKEIVFYGDIQKAVFPAQNAELREAKILTVSQEPKVSEYELLMGGYDAAKMMWNYYTVLLFHNDRSGSLLRPDEITRTFLNYFDKYCFCYSSEDAFNKLNKLKAISAIKVERNVIGPFYSGEVLAEQEAPAEIKKMLSGLPDDFILAVEENSVENAHIYLAKEYFKEEKAHSHLSKNSNFHFICSSDQVANMLYDLYTNYEHPIKCLVTELGHGNE